MTHSSVASCYRNRPDGELGSYVDLTVLFQFFASGLAQRGEDDEGFDGFLIKDIKKEISRSRRLVSQILFLESSSLSVSQCYKYLINQAEWPYWEKFGRTSSDLTVYVYYIFGRDAMSAESLVQQLAVVIKDVPKLFTINVEGKEEAYFSSLIASSKYMLGYQSKNSPNDYASSILLHFDEQCSCIKSLT